MVGFSSIFFAYCALYLKINPLTKFSKYAFWTYNSILWQYFRWGFENYPNLNTWFQNKQVYNANFRQQLQSLFKAVDANETEENAKGEHGPNVGKEVCHITAFQHYIPWQEYKMSKWVSIRENFNIEGIVSTGNIAPESIIIMKVTIIMASIACCWLRQKVDKKDS